MTQAPSVATMETPVRRTARLDPAGMLVVYWRDHTGRQRSEHIGSCSPVLRSPALRRRWAFEELRRAGWGCVSAWAVDQQCADIRPVIRRNPL